MRRMVSVHVWATPMAKTSYGVNHPMAVKLWASVLAVEALKRTWFAQLIGSKPYSVIHIKDQTQKSRGDQVTFGLRMQLSGEGRQGAEAGEGHEEALDVYTDAIIIDMHADGGVPLMRGDRFTPSDREPTRCTWSREMPSA